MRLEKAHQAAAAMTHHRIELFEILNLITDTRGRNVHPRSQAGDLTLVMRQELMQRRIQQADRH